MALINYSEILHFLGWNETCESFWTELNSFDLIPARIIGQEKTLYRVQLSKDRVGIAHLTGKIWHGQGSPIELPGVGDWVACLEGNADKTTQIQYIFPRKSILQRKAPGASSLMQLIATNVDYMFIASSLNEDFNVRRIERYLSVAREAGTQPILLLTKADLSSQGQDILSSLNLSFPDLTIHLLSQKDPGSLVVLEPYFNIGMTSIILGSSGVGKSTLVNFLCASESQKTQQVSRDSKGRHTTTSRQLLFTQWGGMIIDTPGMKEVSTQDEQTTELDYSDVEEIFLRCKFTDCKHQTEPGCAVTLALKEQSLSQERWQKYLTRNSQGRQNAKQMGVKTQAKIKINKFAHCKD